MGGGYCYERRVSGDIVQYSQADATKPRITSHVLESKTHSNMEMTTRMYRGAIFKERELLGLSDDFWRRIEEERCELLTDIDHLHEDIVQLTHLITQQRLPTHVLLLPYQMNH